MQQASRARQKVWSTLLAYKLIRQKMRLMVEEQKTHTDKYPENENASQLN